MKRILKVLVSRLTILAFLIIIQVIFLYSLFYQTIIAYQLIPVLEAIGILLVLYIINRREEPYYKIAWCIIVLGLPIIGVPLYFMAGDRKVPKKIRYGTIRANQYMENLLEEDNQILDKLKEDNINVHNIFSYGTRQCGFPTVQNTVSQYFNSGEEWKEVLLEELKKAKHFIFIEFFIIDFGHFFDQVLEILKEKVKEGVEVIVIYDDFGSITLPRNYNLKLKEYGIEAYRFNKLRPAFLIQMNNRDHRKIISIDNKVGFTGGANIGDEYANEINRFGYWKDSAIMLKGEAVWSLTVMFLGMLTYLKDGDIDFQKYHLSHDVQSEDGYYQPFSDSPTDGEAICLGMHLNLINHAEERIYIDTPYLVLNESMNVALRQAAKNGIDVRILVPGKPDKIITNQITKGNYVRLLEAGVKIYEFTPGFNHCKNIVVDGKLGLVGTINTDYRSYYLHFEDAVLMYQTEDIKKMEESFLNAIAQSKEILLEEAQSVSLPTRFFRGILTAIRPLF